MAALSRLQGALRTLISDVPADVRRAADLERALVLDRMVAWSVYRTAFEPDPMAAGALVPGPGRMSSFLAAAARVGIRGELIDEARSAFSEFETLVTEQAGDRSSFNSMVQNFAGELIASEYIKVRRQAFRSARAILGLQVRTRLNTHVYFPDASGTYLSALVVRGTVGLRALRPDFIRPEMRYRQNEIGFRTGKDAHAPRFGDMHAIGMDLVELAGDGRSRPSGVGFLPEYSTNPPPSVRLSASAPPSEEIIVRIEPRGLGNSSAVTYLMPSLHPRAKRLDDDTDDLKTDNGMLSPTEVLVTDMLVHDDVLRGVTPEIGVFCDSRASGVSWKDAQPYRLPPNDSFSLLGRGLGTVSSPDVPNYPRILEDLLKRCNVDPARLRCYRLRIEYPILHSIVSMRVPLAGSAGDGSF
ncbi:MAG: hypothetical protein IT438_01790 [Phycisphaerales bacterium]|nr:hypothetical protein [Phycisphaerales bacterium]